MISISYAIAMSGATRNPNATGGFSLVDFIVLGLLDYAAIAVLAWLVQHGG